MSKRKESTSKPRVFKAHPGEVGKGLINQASFRRTMKNIDTQMGNQSVFNAKANKASDTPQ